MKQSNSSISARLRFKMKRHILTPTTDSRDRPHPYSAANRRGARALHHWAGRAGSVAGASQRTTAAPERIAGAATLKILGDWKNDFA